MDHWITTFMNDFGYIGVFLLVALENVFPPIPSEVILTFGGFMTTYSALTVTGVVTSATVGSVVGAVVLYWLGSLIDITRVEQLIARWGRIIRLTPADVHKAYGGFTKYGVWAVFLCRLVPIVRSLISLPAGSTRMNFGVFLAFTALGSVIWNAVLIGLGAAVGASWEKIVAYLEIYSNIVYLLLAFACVAIALYLLLWRKPS